MWCRILEIDDLSKNMRKTQDRPSLIKSTLFLQSFEDFSYGCVGLKSHFLPFSFVSLVPIYWFGLGVFVSHLFLVIVVLELCLKLVLWMMNTLRPWQKNTPESLLGSTTCSAQTKTLIKLIIEYTEISVHVQSLSSPSPVVCGRIKSIFMRLKKMFWRMKDGAN